MHTYDCILQSTSRRHGIVSLIIMNIPTVTLRCNHLHGKKGDLCDVEVLMPQQLLHVMEVNSEK